MLEIAINRLYDQKRHVIGLHFKLWCLSNHFVMTLFPVSAAPLSCEQEV